MIWKTLNIAGSISNIDRIFKFNMQITCLARPTSDCRMILVRSFGLLDMIRPSHLLLCFRRKLFALNAPHRFLEPMCWPEPNQSSFQVLADLQGGVWAFERRVRTRVCWFLKYTPAQTFSSSFAFRTNLPARVTSNSSLHRLSLCDRWSSPLYQNVNESITYLSEVRKMMALATSSSLAIRRRGMFCEALFLKPSYSSSE